MQDTDTTNGDFLQQLRRNLDQQISSYVYEHPAGALGNPLSSDQIRDYLNSMRLCLVEPHCEEVNICNTSEEPWTGVGVKRTCVTMAEDQNYVLVFDSTEQQYHLAWRGDDGLGTWGIRGDAVGCFIAR